MKDNTHFRNLRDSMMVSLKAFLKYNHNVPTHIISANKILTYYSISSKNIVPESLELKSEIRQTVWNVLPSISLDGGVLKGVESNKSWFERPSVIRIYERILFPTIVENKEFPHSYKKDELPTSVPAAPVINITKRHLIFVVWLV